MQIPETLSTFAGYSDALTLALCGQSIGER